MTTPPLRAGAACLLARLVAAPAHAAPVQVQGYLTDLDGVPQAGERSVSVTLFGASIGGEASWGPVVTATDVVDGHFSLSLDADDDGGATAEELLDGDGPLFVEVAVLDEGETTVLEPRLQLFSVPWSLQAGVVDAETHDALRGQDGADGPQGPPGPVVLAAGRRRRPARW